MQHRKKNNLTQTALADRVGISSRALGNIERGSDTRVSVLIAIADTLNIPAAELLKQSSPDSCVDMLNAQEREAICRHLKAIVALLPKDEV